MVEGYAPKAKKANVSFYYVYNGKQYHCHKTDITLTAHMGQVR